MLTIMRLSIIEQMRRRVLRVLAVLTVIIVLITAWGFDQLIISSRRFMDDVPLEVIESSLSQVLVFVMFMFSFVLAMVAASLGAPAISGEVESGQALALFARPLSRTRFVVGRWMGLAAVVGAYALVSGGLELLTVAVVTGFVPRSPIGAMGYLAAQGVVILTLSVVLSTRLPAVASGAIGIVLFGITWVVGIMGSAGRLLGSTALSDLSRVLRFVFPSDALWRVAADNAAPPPRSLFDDPFAFTATRNPFASGGPSDPGYLLYVCVWIVAMLALAAFSLSRREL